jgi:NADPH-dependent ferric siderophore reductase
MSRITLQLDGLAGFQHTGPDQLVRVFFPLAHQTVPIVPVSEDWWPECQELPEAIRPVVRNYTVRRFDPASRQVDLDFVRHGDTGPGSRWAGRAKPGDVIGLLTDGHEYNEPEGTTSRLVIGDESALPAVGAIVEWLPADADARVLVEVADAAEEQPLANVNWVHRGSSPAGTGTLMVERLRAVPITAEGLYVWVAGEAGLVKAVRRHLVDRGVPKRQICFSGYWLHKTNDNAEFIAAVEAELAV